MNRSSCCRYILWPLVWFPVATLQGQEDRAPNSPPKAEITLPQIADEPKLIDPATVMPADLAAVATVDLTDSSLRELVRWLQDDQQLVVLTEQSALSDAGILPGDPISDHLDASPIYLMLDRLGVLGLAWYFDDGVLHITTDEVAGERLTTIPYNLGDLLDAGYKIARLGETIESAIDPESWESVGGMGAISFLGDVLFVRQTDATHRQVQGLLAALRTHARQTFVLEPRQHLALRAKLEDNVDVDFQDTPLDAAVAKLREDLGIDIRLDIPALREIRVRQRQPVTLKLTNRKLQTVLQAMMVDFDLTWILRDGVLWITSSENAESFLKTAVYDVRDLCRDESESDALVEAVVSQTPNVWEEYGGPASVQFAKPGTLVVCAQEYAQRELLTLLETYRTALRSSQQRDRDTDDPNEVFTVYYRLHSNVAQDLFVLLRRLIAPDSWRDPSNPQGHGEILLAASPPDLFTADGKLARAADDDESSSAEAIVVSRSVLIVRQTRSAHDEIEKVIQRLETGDAWRGDTGGGMGGGGFGGGFF